MPQVCLYKENKNKKSSTEKKIMDLENRLVVARGEGEGLGGTGSLGLGCKLLLLEWINNEILLFSTQNYCLDIYNAA